MKMKTYDIATGESRMRPGIEKPILGPYAEREKG
jgi:hypothetical protein